MIRNLRADFYRIRKGNQGVISMILILILGIFLTAIGKEYDTKELIESALSSGSLFMPILFSNILMITWGYEFSYRTVNNALIAKANRLKFFISKVLLSFLLTLGYLFLYAISIILGTVIFKGRIEIIYTIKLILAQFPMYLAVISLGTLLFHVVDAIYVAVAIFLVISLLGDSITSLVISTYFKNFGFLMDYQFVANISKITNMSFLPLNTILIYMGSAVAFCVVFMAVSYQVFARREFK